MSGAPVDNPEDLSVREVYDMFLDAHQLDYTDETLRDYETRLRQFVEWSEDEADEIETIGDVTGFHLEQFKLYRQGQDLAPTTMKGQMATLKKFLEYAASIEAVDEWLPHKVNIPKLDQSEETNDVLLDAEDAKAAIEYYRDSPTQYATHPHVALELCWYTGARLGAIRSLDMEDYKADDQILWFHHRPPTVLKKKEQGERPVGLPEEVCEVLDAFIEYERFHKRDNDGRRPLLSARQGRPSNGTIQGWVYRATIPCNHSPCPHGKTRETCSWTTRQTASRCPSSRSPHQVRTGSITWQLNRGLSWEGVGERVNSDPDTLRRYYDKASDLERLEERRRSFIEDLQFNDSDSDNDND